MLNHGATASIIILVTGCLVWLQALTTDSVDFLTRSQWSDFFINNYHLFWTSSWYLPGLAAALICGLRTYVHHSYPIIWHLMLFYASTFLLINSNTLYPITMNELNWSDNLNPLLSNSINKFHPLMLYIAIFVLIRSALLLALGENSRYSTSRYVSLVHATARATTILISTTLFLGSWWAAQEGSWGGWWNWDASEVFGLLIMLSHLLSLHQVSSVRTCLRLKFINEQIVWLVAFVYFFIQLNFDLVSHNFGTRSDQFIDLTQFLSVSLLTASLLFINSTTTRSCITQTTYLTTNHEILRLSRALPYVVLILWLILLHGFSFAVLLNDLLWKVASVNLFNAVQINTYYSPVSFVLLLLFSWTAGLYRLITALFFTVTTASTILLYNSVSNTPVAALHNLLLQTLFSMTNEASQYVSTWSQLSFAQSHLLIQALTDYGLPYTSVSGASQERSYPTLSSSQLVDLSWNFTRLSLSMEIHTFVHSAQSDNLTQSLLSGNLVYNYAITVLDSQLPSTLALFFFLISLLTLTMNKKLVILH